MSHTPLWPWISWRGKSKLPNEHPLEHCVKQKAIKGRFPSFPSTAWFDYVSNVSAYRGSSSSISNSTFPGLGFESQSRQFFFVFPSLNFLQRSINGEYFLNNFIDWLIWVVIEVTSQKMALTGVRTPNLEKWIWNGTGTATPRCRGKHRESALWLPIAWHSVPMGVH